MKTQTVIASLALFSMALVGCAPTQVGDSTPAPTAPEGEAASTALDTVVVGVIPISDVAPIYLGKEKGIFEEYGIDLVIETGPGGAAITTSVVSGEYQFGITNIVSLFIARNAGLPVIIAAPSSQSTGVSGGDYAALMVREDSGIDSVSDLAGKRVGINGLANANDVLLRAALDEAGADSTSVNFVEIPFPEMAAALGENQVDAVFAPEPFVTIIASQGNQELFSLYADVVDNFPASLYLTTDEFAAANADLVNRFEQAMIASNEYAMANIDEAQDILTTYTPLERDFVEVLTLPLWPSEIDENAVRRMFELTVIYGLIEDNQTNLDAVLTR